ncbi:tetratricopeptide repeat protein [Methanobacterium sp.]|uniref:tetratricopeptide repeat protein n=1 Tax=Methanobacterium sp. TaxID=2164 RepID=UPI0025CD5A61|nr:hypothetical protein [Methanobacterium sp.]MBI5459619.1 hypothetical protein [Methanobacterium sp.]MDY9922499.1 hypothetical protein [Methanobacterium sp.]
MKGGLYAIMIGIFGIIVTMPFYLKDPSLYSIPFLLTFLMVIIGGLFDLREEYSNNNFYLIVIMFLVVIWILGFIQPLSQDINQIAYYIETGLITLMFIAAIRSMLKGRNKIEKLLEPYEKILAVNPNDTTALNNKGVKLFEFFRYNESMQCFDKILKINQNDATALHNKDFVEEMRDHTLVDYFKKIPKYKVIEKENKLILEAK